MLGWSYNRVMTTREPKVTIKHNGRTWYRTGKRGHAVATGIATAEYDCDNLHGSRLWADYSGTVTEESA